MSQTGVEFSYLIWYSKCWLDDFFFFFYPNGRPHLQSHLHAKHPPSSHKHLQQLPQACQQPWSK